MSVKSETNIALSHYATYPLSPTDLFICNKTISTKICVSAKATYKILYYDKTILSRLDTLHDKYRSVVFSYPENKLLSFSPPKSIEYTDFKKKYPINTITATEKIEGISITLFYDFRLQTWEISTKTNIGGHYWYFYRDCDKTPTTFYDMFLDALVQPRNTQLNDVSIFEYLSKNYCYSFVLQHPENIITIPIKSPKLWLVAVYEIYENNAIHIPSYVYKRWSYLMNINGIIHYPKTIECNSYNQLEKYIAKYNKTPFFFSEGIVLWNEKTGERTLLNNSNYMDVVTLRKLIPYIQYEYFCMKRIGKTLEYTENFPQSKKTVYAMEKLYTKFITTLHVCYMNVYVFKTVAIETVNMQYRPYVEDIHKTIYLPSINVRSYGLKIHTDQHDARCMERLDINVRSYGLKIHTDQHDARCMERDVPRHHATHLDSKTRKPIKITREIVKNYIDEMEPMAQLFLFSYLRRELDTYNNN
jgi:hypothetical protein